MHFTEFSIDQAHNHTLSQKLMTIENMEDRKQSKGGSLALHRYRPFLSALMIHHVVGLLLESIDCHVLSENIFPTLSISKQ